MNAPVHRPTGHAQPAAGRDVAALVALASNAAVAGSTRADRTTGAISNGSARSPCTCSRSTRCRFNRLVLATDSLSSDVEPFFDETKAARIRPLEREVPVASFHSQAFRGGRDTARSPAGDYTVVRSADEWLPRGGRHDRAGFGRSQHRVRGSAGLHQVVRSGPVPPSVRIVRRPHHARRRPSRLPLRTSAHPVRSSNRRQTSMTAASPARCNMTRTGVGDAEGVVRAALDRNCRRQPAPTQMLAPSFVGSRGSGRNARSGVRRTSRIVVCGAVHDQRLALARVDRHSVGLAAPAACISTASTAACVAVSARCREPEARRGGRVRTRRRREPCRGRCVGLPSGS